MSYVAAGVCAGFLVSAAIVAASTQQAAQPPVVFRTGVTTVSLWATVRDDHGRFVPNLTRDDFELRVGGKPTEIAVFSADEQPITVCLLMDMSGSVTRRLLRVREGAIHFVRALKTGDRARIGTFGAEIAISPVLTGDQSVLEQILREELWPGGGTPLWGAVGAALESLQGEPGRRVLLTLTDGYSTWSLPGYPAGVAKVREMLNDPGLVAYTIGVADLRPIMATGETDLAVMAVSSGGASFELADDADLEQTFTRIAEELRSQYLIGFIPDSSVSGTQRVAIRARGYQVRSRSTFDLQERR